MTPDALALLHATAFEQDRPWSPEEFSSLLTHQGMLLLGDDRAFVLGRVVLDEAEVLTLATHPDHRRLGLAAMLLARFEQEAAAMGADRAFLEVAEDNAPARALYAGRGYSEAGRRPAYYRRSGSAPVAALVLRCPFR